MENIDREAIIRRAAKLAAFNDKNASPEEAMLAAERLAAMLKENNMSMRDIDVDRIKKGIRQEAVHDLENRRKWVSWLSYAIATACDCKVIVVEYPTCIYYFVGYEEDAIVASWFFERMRDILPGICAKHMKAWKKIPRAGYSREYLREKQKAEKNGFMSGFSTRIGTKIRDVIKPKEETTENHNEFALIDLKKQAVDEKYKEWFPKAYLLKNKERFSEEGKKAGAEAAEKVSVNIPLPETMEHKRLT